MKAEPSGRAARQGPALPGTARGEGDPRRPLPARTCGEDLPQDHLRHLGGGQPGPTQHLTDHDGPQFVRRQGRQAAVEGTWAGTEGEGSAPGTGRRGGGHTPAAGPGLSPTAVLAAATKTTGSALMAAAGAERGGSWKRERQARPETGAGFRAAAGGRAAPRVVPVPPLARRGGQLPAGSAPVVGGRAPGRAGKLGGRPGRRRWGEGVLRHFPPAGGEESGCKGCRPAVAARSPSLWCTRGLGPASRRCPRAASVGGECCERNGGAAGRGGPVPGAGAAGQPAGAEGGRRGGGGDGRKAWQGRRAETLP